MKQVLVVLVLLVVAALLQLAGVDVVAGLGVVVDTTAGVLVAVWDFVRSLA